MTPSTIIEAAAEDGVKLTLCPDGTANISGDKAAIAEWLSILRANKAAIVTELHRARRRAKVLLMLEAKPRSKYAVLVEDDTTDPVIAAVAIRGIASFEMSIPHHSYNGMVLLELVEKHSKEKK